jgi:hypothetical protein
VDHRDNLRAEPVPVPVLVRNGAQVERSVVRSADGSLVFHTSGIGRPRDVTLRPFWEISFDRYNVYWDVLTEAQWESRGAQAQAGH